MDLDFNGDTVHIGAIVDEVLSVVEIEEGQIEPPPGIGNKYKSDFIFGMAKVREEFVMLLDMQKVLSSGEIADLADQTKQGTTT
jgi:purine-binding chemotaxis protein CheW